MDNHGAAGVSQNVGVLVDLVSYTVLFLHVNYYYARFNVLRHSYFITMVHLLAHSHPFDIGFEPTRFVIMISLVEAPNVFDYSMVKLELLEQPLGDKVFRCSIPTSILPLKSASIL